MCSDRFSPRSSSFGRAVTLRFDRLDAMKMAALVTFALAVVTTGCGSSSPTQVNVSRWPLPQNEVSAAIDPNKPDVLLVGSNSLQEGQTRSYTSTDGGATWTTELAPPLATGFSEVDPAVAIDASGREYFASLQTRRRSDGLADHQLFASTRSGPGGEWGAPVAVDQPFGLAPLAIDDKDAIAVDGTRVYLTWSRFLNWTNPKHNRYSIMLARTTNGGRSWSTPVAVTTTTKTINLIYASVGARGKNVYV